MRVPGTAAVRHPCRVHTASTADNQQVNHFGEMDHDIAEVWETVVRQVDSPSGERITSGSTAAARDTAAPSPDGHAGR